MSSSGNRSNLTPLAARLCEALDHVASTDQRLAVIVKAFARHLRKNPVPDDAILAALDWIEAMAQGVRTGQPVTLDDALLTPDSGEPPDADSPESGPDLDTEFTNDLNNALAGIGD